MANGVAARPAEPVAPARERHSPSEAAPPTASRSANGVNARPAGSTVEVPAEVEALGVAEKPAKAATPPPHKAGTPAAAAHAAALRSDRRAAEPATDTAITPLEAPAHPSQAPRRRRRSASLLPPLPSPADIPDDAAGRVEIFAIATLPDVTLPNSVLTPPSISRDAEPVPTTAVAGTGALDGRLPVVILGVALLVVFVVGVLVTR